MNKLFFSILLGLTVFSTGVFAGKSTGVRSVSNASSSSNSSNTNTSSGYSSMRSDAKHELVLSATQGLISFSGGNSSLDVRGMYGHFFVPQIEGAVELSLSNSSNGGTATIIFFDGIYNFQPEYSNAFFAFAGFGITSYSGRNNSSSTSGMKFGGGKRIQMWGPVSLMPMAWIQKDGSADAVTNIMPLNFTVLF
jgi:hypothetical protein